MSPTGLAIIYIIIWWIVFFAILPIDVERKKIIKIHGEDPGSPENPKMFKKYWSLKAKMDFHAACRPRSAFLAGTPWDSLKSLLESFSGNHC